MTKWCWPSAQFGSRTIRLQVSLKFEYSWRIRDELWMDRMDDGWLTMAWAYRLDGLMKISTFNKEGKGGDATSALLLFSRYFRTPLPALVTLYLSEPLLAIQRFSLRSISSTISIPSISRWSLSHTFHHINQTRRLQIIVVPESNWARPLPQLW